MSNKYIPNKIVTIRQSKPPWIHNDIRKYIRKRKRAYDKAKISQNPRHWQAYKQLRNKTTNMLRQAKHHLSLKISDKLKQPDLKTTDYCRILKQFIAPTNKSSIDTLHDNGNIVIDNTDKANLLNNFFQAQTQLNDQNKTLPPLHVNPDENVLTNIQITEDEVEITLISLNTGKASGPDNINSRILKKLSDEIASPLCSLFNRSLHIGKSGFVPNDSTSNQLVSIYNSFCQALDEGKEVRAVFCDISKSFDRVWHRGLLHKLESKGISGQLLLWFKDYLSGRRQRVVLCGFYSETVLISAGVPQGSILGPLLFILYINDIVTDIGSTICLFADDTSLYITVDDPIRSAITLNTDLNTITNWAEKWLVDFNPNKTTFFAHFTKTQQTISPSSINEWHSYSRSKVSQASRGHIFSQWNLA
ncbi:uncharacterized protein LOC128549303 [Mercenaria mercenaria]|uniref:uncharacterized protein LOC128549303 n=1 Tax=Mercenaria mercenaria TaxID=6596 RepID=UPI00234F1C43|nr:uncharacterized protein LOC128549303 [Mercenaria mercenaria]